MDTGKTIYLKPTKIGCSLFNLAHVNVIPIGQVKHNLVCYLKWICIITFVGHFVTVLDFISDIDTTESSGKGKLCTF